MWRTLIGGVVGVLLLAACRTPPAGRLGADDTSSLPPARRTQSRPVRSTASVTHASSTTAVASAPLTATTGERPVAPIDGAVAPATAALRLADALDSVRATTPDPATVTAIVIAGEQLARDTQRELTALRRAGQHRVAVAVRRRVVRVASFGPGTAEVFVDVVTGESRVVARDGSVVSRAPLAGTRWVYFLAWYPHHTWVLADVFELDPSGAR